MRTLLYLNRREFANYLKLTLRTPKRLLPMLLVLLYLLTVLSPTVLMHRYQGGAMRGVMGGYDQREIWSIAFVIFSLALVYFIYKSFSESLLVFQLPEIDYLFSTPVSRQMIVLSKLLKLYAKIGLFVLFYMLILSPTVSMATRQSQGELLPVAAVAAMLFAALVINVCTTLNLITTFRAGGNWWLAWLVKGMALALFAFALIACAAHYRETGNILDSVESTFRSPVLLAILFPAKWTADLVLSPVYGWQDVFGTELILLCVCSLASLCMVLLRGENPYEPSLSISEKAAARRSALRSGGFAQLLAEAMKNKAKSVKVKHGIPPFGTGAWAVVWKNFNVGLRTWSKSYLIGFACMLGAFLAFSLFSRQNLAPAFLASTAVPVAATYLMMFTSWSMLGVFSADIRQANVLRPMPIKNWKLIAASAIQGPLTVIVIVWPLAIILTAFSDISTGSSTLLICLSLPFVVYAACCAQSLVAAIYPNREDQFQQFAALMLSGFATMVSIIPACITGLAAWYFTHSTLISAPAIIIPSLFMSAVGILFGDYAYRRYDPTGE